MNKKFNEVSLMFLVGLFAAVLVFGGFQYFEKPIVIPDAIKGGQGDAGLRGPMGPQGPQGVAGKDGKDAVVDMNKLVDEVADELEDRQNAVMFSFSGVDGNYTLQFEIVDPDSFKFTLKHFGVGRFVVSLIDKDNNLSTLLDTNGHVIVMRERNLVKGAYKLVVSADSNWSVEIKEQ